MDWISVAITALAAIALLRFRQGVMPVILVCALAGFVVGLA